MQTFTTPDALAAQCHDWFRAQARTALVPTMGALHAGHASLLDHARRTADTVIVSIFVNPTQFSAGEDLDAYPRALEADAATAQAHGADALFAPTVEAMYLPGHATWVETPRLAAGLCGASRPGHFRGVCTVVAKLLTLTLPTLAVFGEKDWQQLTIIRRMTQDLHLPTQIVGRPTVREADGLAMSSRNAYLAPEERRQAPALFQGLEQAKALVDAGEEDPDVLRRRVGAFYAEALPLGRLEYLEFVHPETLEPCATVTGPVLAAVAMRLGKARLIDNLLLVSA